jgi:two-component system LytT family response regulator
VIIDDEPSGINSLTLLLQKYATDVRVVASTTDAEEGIRMINDYCPDIVFLDIKMPFLNGFELLERLSFRSFHLVFTTAHEEYALQALKQNAIDYLLKPIDADDLHECLARIRKKQKGDTFFDIPIELTGNIGKQLSNRIFVPAKDGFAFVNAEDIVRLEADSNYTRIFLMNKISPVVARTLKEYEKILCIAERQFMRVHQSHIINLTHVSRYLKEDGGSIVMRDSSRVPLSKHKRDEFFAWMGI